MLVYNSTYRFQCEWEEDSSFDNHYNLHDSSAIGSTYSSRYEGKQTLVSMKYIHLPTHLFYKAASNAAKSTNRTHSRGSAVRQG